MRNAAKGLLIVLALLVPLVIVAVRRRTADERPVADYATRAQAAAAGAFARGWLPPFLPPSARAIRDVHDLDTNERWLRFEADSAELATLAAHLTPLAWGVARRSAARRPRTAGMDWPPELAEQQLVTARSTRLLGYYRDPAAAYCLAIEWRTGRAWGWSCASAG